MYKITNIANLRKLNMVIVLIILLICGACEIDTKINVSSENPPQFAITGNGILAQLYVSGPFTLEEIKLIAPDKLLTKEEVEKIRKTIGGNRILWQIDPGTGKRIRGISPIVYGRPPEGFKQVYPQNDIKPAALIEGNYYSVYAPSHNANNQSSYFIIKNGVANIVNLN